MIITSFRKDIPDWAREHMWLTCPHCGCYIADNSDTGVTTARWCINPACPGHMAYKVMEICKHFGIKGIGEKSALDLCKMHKWKNPCECIPYFFPNNKPVVTLADIAVFFNIDGYGSTLAVRELSSFESFEDYFLNAKPVNYDLIPYKDQLIEAQRYFTLKRPYSKVKVNVMATGAFNGFTNRDAFFAAINDKFGDKVHVINVGKRKTNVQFLVKEVDAPDRSKTQMAIENKIPIVTPLQFYAIIEKLATYNNEE